MPEEKDYSKFSREELIEKLQKLEARKKYGLIWDEERTKEKFEQDAENALPILKEVKSRSVDAGGKGPTHILIEGDNYQAWYYQTMGAFPFRFTISYSISSLTEHIAPL